MWICKKCKEENEDNFDVCWKCQTSLEITFDRTELSEDQSNTIIKEMLKGIIFIGERTYLNFINSYKYSLLDYGDATKLESEIGSLFLFDFLSFKYDSTEKFRQMFMKICFDDIIVRYTDKVENKNITDLVEHRYLTYAKIPSELNIEKPDLTDQEYTNTWQRYFMEALFRNLRATKGQKTIEKTNIIGTETLYSPLFSITPDTTYNFTDKQIGNCYTTLKIIDELFKGRTFADLADDDWFEY